jgi:fatty-acyl-CoA synthase
MRTVSLGTVNLLRKPRTAHLTNPERVAIRYEDKSYTYDELEERASRLASGLQQAGFEKGQRVCILSYNRVEWFEIFFAIAKLGGVMVPVNYYMRSNEVRYLVENSGAQWFICEDRLWDIVSGFRDNTSQEFTSLVIGDPVTGTLAYEDVVRDGSPEGVDVDVTMDDLFLFQYTSGTTGFPKGAMHTHETVMWNAFHQIVDLNVTRDDVYLLVPALCWAAGFHDFTLAVLWAGGTVVLSPSTKFDAESLLDLVERERVTQIILVSSVLQMVLESPTIEQRDLSCLKTILTGGEPVPVSALEEMQRRLSSCSLIQGYGMSEFPAAMLLLDGANAIDKRGSAGRAVSIADIRVVDADGNDTAPGVVGQIICRSPAVMVGYHDAPEATAQTLVGGWLHTGDLAHMDEDGFVYIVGRAKDMIISGGLNVYPAEVERLLVEHPMIAEASIVGVPDPKWGEVGRAHIVLADVDRPDVAELDRYLRERTASYKIPRQWVFSDQLPRNASGKVVKAQLRELSDIDVLATAEGGSDGEGSIRAARCRRGDHRRQPPGQLFE